MTIWCKHAHRLEQQKFWFVCAVHLPVGLDIAQYITDFLMIFPVFLIFDMVIQNKKSGISSIYLAQLANAQHKN